MPGQKVAHLHPPTPYPKTTKHEESHLVLSYHVDHLQHEAEKVAGVETVPDCQEEETDALGEETVTQKPTSLVDVPGNEKMIIVKKKTHNLMNLMKIKRLYHNLRLTSTVTLYRTSTATLSKALHYSIFLIVYYIINEYS